MAHKMPSRLISQGELLSLHGLFFSFGGFLFVSFCFCVFVLFLFLFLVFVLCSAHEAWEMLIVLCTGPQSPSFVARLP